MRMLVGFMGREPLGMARADAEATALKLHVLFDSSGFGSSGSLRERANPSLTMYCLVVTED